MSKGINLVLAALVMISCAVSANASRILTTPFAEVPKAGDYKLFTFALRESRSADNWRTLQRLDLGVTNRTELGILVINPENAPTSTWINIQHRLVRETPAGPAFSIGVWDAANIDKFSGQKTGGSFFAAASKSLPLGKGTPPLKLSLGAGTNRLNGIFGGMIVPFSKKLGVMAEYSPRNLRLTGADAVNVSLYCRPTPQWQLRASSVGGNPMLDLYFAETIGL